MKRKVIERQTLLPSKKTALPKNILIVLFLGENVNIYQREFVQRLSQVQISCPICQGKCHWHAWYERGVKQDLIQQVIRLLRVKCPTCGKTHAILPDFLKPRHRYSQHTREPSVMACVAGVPAEKASQSGQAVETTRRWVKKARAELSPIISALTALLARLGEYITPRGAPPILQLAGQVRRLMVKLKGIPSYSCWFGLVNILLSLDQVGYWL